MNEPPVDKDILETPVGRGVRQWLNEWPGFQREYGEWLNSLEHSDVLYVLPLDFIEFLGTPKKIPRGDAYSGGDMWRESPSLLSPEEVEAEQALHELCERHRPDCVGVAGGVPVLYALLATPLPYPAVTRKDIQDLEWPAERGVDLEIRDLERTFEMATVQEREIQARLMAYAGRLIGREEFRRERDELRARWETLPQDLRTTGPFAFPVRRLNCLTGRDRARYAELGDGFLKKLEGFLAKWSLIEMTTWDLPSPQGPLAGMPPHVVGRLTGRPVVVDYYPPFYPVSSDRDLNEELRADQERRARELGVPVGVRGGFPPAGLTPRHQKDQPLQEAGYATAFRIYFAELAFRRRYGNRRGFGTRLEEFLIARWELNDSRRIRQLRATYKGALD